MLLAQIVENGADTGTFEVDGTMVFYIVKGTQRQSLSPQEVETLYNSPNLVWRDDVYRQATLKYIKKSLIGTSLPDVEGLGGSLMDPDNEDVLHTIDADDLDRQDHLSAKERGSMRMPPLQLIVRFILIMLVLFGALAVGYIGLQRMGIIGKEKSAPPVSNKPTAATPAAGNAVPSPPAANTANPAPPNVTPGQDPFPK